MRSVRRIERQKAELELKGEYGASRARDILVHAKVLWRRSLPVRMPAYLLEFEHGKTLTMSQEIVPARFSAVVSGVTGAVASDRIFSQGKARSLAAAATCVCGFLPSAIGASQAELLRLFVEWSLLGTIGTTFAGVIAEAAPRHAHRLAQQRRIESEDAHFQSMWERSTHAQRCTTEFGVSICASLSTSGGVNSLGF